jgi:hypothetical protein
MAGVEVGSAVAVAGGAAADGAAVSALVPAAASASAAWRLRRSKGPSLGRTAADAALIPAPLGCVTETGTGIAPRWIWELKGRAQKQRRGLSMTTKTKRELFSRVLCCVCVWCRTEWFNVG